MRILAISNFYPPHGIGGYEQGCRDVLEGLAARGHRVQVLTSTYGTGRERMEKQGEANPVVIHRQLYFHWKPNRPWNNLWELASIEKQGLAAFYHLLRACRPEVLSMWNMAGLSQSLITAAQESGLPLVYHISDEWPRQLGGDPWLHFWCRRPRKAFKRPVKSALVGLLKEACRKRLCFQMPHKEFTTCHFASEFLRRSLISAGLKVGRAEVIHWGVRPLRPRLSPPASRNGNSPSLLYLGQLVPHKGPHVLLEALGLLRDKMGYGDPSAEFTLSDLSRAEPREAEGLRTSISLTLAGTAPEPEYSAGLRRLVEEKGLSRQVRFLPPQPRERLAELCAEHEIFVFPSIWQEPFSIALLEAMAAGLAVVATATGGTPEVVRDRENGLLCPPDDARELAEKIEILVWNRALRQTLAKAAQETIRKEFDLTGMLDRVERLLLSAPSAEFTLSDLSRA